MAYSTVKEALDAATARYIEHNPESKKLHDNATEVFPGGNTRTVLHAAPFPLCMKFGAGYQVTSEDGDT